MPEGDEERRQTAVITIRHVSVFVCVCAVTSNSSLIAKGRWGGRDNRHSRADGGWRIQISLAEFMNDWDQRATWTNVCALLSSCMPSGVPNDGTVVLNRRERDGDGQRDDTKCQEDPQSSSLRSADMSVWCRVLKEEAHLVHFRLEVDTGCETTQWVVEHIKEATYKMTSITSPLSTFLS